MDCASLCNVCSFDENELPSSILSPNDSSAENNNHTSLVDEPKIEKRETLEVVYDHDLHMKMSEQSEELDTRTRANLDRITAYGANSSVDKLFNGGVSPYWYHCCGCSSSLCFCCCNFDEENLVNANRKLRDTFLAKPFMLKPFGMSTSSNPIEKNKPTSIFDPISLATQCPFPNLHTLKLLLANGAEGNYLQPVTDQKTGQRRRASAALCAMAFGARTKNYVGAKLLIAKGYYCGDCMEEYYVADLKETFPECYEEFYDETGKLLKITDPFFTADISHYSIDPSQEVLYNSCRMGMDLSVKRIFEASPHLFKPLGWDHSTPLHHACRGGRFETVRFLISKAGMDVNAVDILGNTPLHDAKKYGHDSTCGVLMREFNARIDVKNKKGEVAYPSCLSQCLCFYQGEIAYGFRLKIRNTAEAKLRKWSNRMQKERKQAVIKLMNASYSMRMRLLTVIENAYEKFTNDPKYTMQGLTKDCLASMEFCIHTLKFKSFNDKVYEEFMKQLKVDPYEVFEKKKMAAMDGPQKFLYRYKKTPLHWVGLAVGTFFLGDPCSDPVVRVIECCITAKNLSDALDAKEKGDQDAMFKFVMGQGKDMLKGELQESLKPK